MKKNKKLKITKKDIEKDKTFKAGIYAGIEICETLLKRNGIEIEFPRPTEIISAKVDEENGTSIILEQTPEKEIIKEMKKRKKKRK